MLHLYPTQSEPGFGNKKSFFSSFGVEESWMCVKGDVVLGVLGGFFLMVLWFLFGGFIA